MPGPHFATREKPLHGLIADSPLQAKKVFVAWPSPGNWSPAGSASDLGHARPRMAQVTSARGGPA